MNKIKVINNKVELFIEDNALEVDIIDRFEIFDVKKLTIKNNQDTDLEIEYESDDSKIDLVIEIKENTTFNLFELRHDNKLKAQYQYYLETNSTLNITKFYDVDDIKELDVVELNGENANINYKLKTIANGVQKYDLVLYHHAKNTISNITNNGVNLTGNINFNVTGIVYNGITDCEINQANRIVTFNDQKCVINPKLLIDENDVVANHSALIGKFSEDELFYLQSRGITYNEAITLLVKGFLLEDLQDERLNKILEKYWR